jgi:hypothetical protein
MRDGSRVAHAASPVASTIRDQLGPVAERILLSAIVFAMFGAGMVMMAAGSRRANTGELPGGLTKREIEVLALIAAGMEATNSEARAGGLRLQETSKGRPRVLLQQVRGPHPTRSPRLPHPAHYAARQPRGKSSGNRSVVVAGVGD